MNEQRFKIKMIMRSIFLLMLSLIGIALNSFAQQTDTIVVIHKNPEKILRKLDIQALTRNGITPWKTKFAGHYAGVDFGFNLFVNEDYTVYENEFMENDVFRSNSTYINLIQQSFGLQKNRNTFGLVTGLGLHLQSYRLDDNTTIYLGENDVVYPETLYFDDNQKSKLSIVSLNIPLLVEVQIPVNHFDNRIYVSAGLLGSYRLNSHTKIKYRTDRKEKLKVEDSFSMHDFKYSVMMRAGYRWFNVFATYDLLPLFKKDKGPELTPVTFGVTLLRF
jgi:hypothetical protein